VKLLLLPAVGQKSCEFISFSKTVTTPTGHASSMTLILHKVVRATTR